MKKNIFTALSILASAALITMIVAGCGGKRGHIFVGGPQGGTYKYAASGITILLKEKLNMNISTQGSEGSQENIRKIDAGKASFTVGYSGDSYLASVGKWSGDSKKYTNVRALGFLYGAPLQVITLKKNGITSITDLKGKRVAIGKQGSGAAATSTRFLKHLKLYDSMKIQHFGYSQAASALKDGKIDAFMVLAGFPTRAIIEVAQQSDMVVISPYKAAEEAGFFTEYPFYSPVTIPANTYKGQTEPIKSFQDSTLWLTHKGVSTKVVYDAMKVVYSKEGMAHMVQTKKTFKAMSINGGLTGVKIPLHPGAEKFWKEKGVLK